MILKTMKFLTKPTKIEIDRGDGTKEFIVEDLPTNKYVILRREVDHISDFSELDNYKGKVYKQRCIVKDAHGEWFIVKHSFNDLLSLKYNTHKVIGYGSSKR